MAELDITIGELSRSLTAMEARMSAQFAAVNQRLDNLQFVNRDTYTVQVGALMDRVEALEEAKRSAWKMFVGAFLFPVLVGIIVALAVAR